MKKSTKRYRSKLTWALPLPLALFFSFFYSGRGRLGSSQWQSFILKTLEKLPILSIFRWLKTFTDPEDILLSVWIYRFVVFNLPICLNLHTTNRRLGGKNLLTKCTDIPKSILKIYRRKITGSLHFTHPYFFFYRFWG